MIVLRALLLSASTLVIQAAWADCDVRASRSAEVDASGVRKVIVDVGAGDLRITGTPNTTAVRVKGEACAESSRALEATQLEVRREGDTVHVIAVMPEKDSYIRNATLDLRIDLPSSVAVEVDDSSGDIEISKVAGARVDDSSGDQSVHDITGDVTIDDSSGDVDVKSIRGAVVVRDSSGDVKVVDIVGNVTIPSDSSGSLSLRRISGDVLIEADSSGDISIEDVNRSVRIDRDSSGDIRVSDVGSDFTVLKDGAGGISHRNVLGKVSLPKK